MAPWWLGDLILAETWGCKPWEISDIRPDKVTYFDRQAWRARGLMYHNLRGEKQKREQAARDAALKAAQNRG